MTLNFNTAKVDKKSSDDFVVKKTYKRRRSLPNVLLSSDKISVTTSKEIVALDPLKGKKELKEFLENLKTEDSKTCEEWINHFELSYEESILSKEELLKNLKETSFNIAKTKKSAFAKFTSCLKKCFSPLISLLIVFLKLFKAVIKKTILISSFVIWFIFLIALLILMIFYRSFMKTGPLPLITNKMGFFGRVKNDMTLSYRFIRNVIKNDTLFRTKFKFVNKKSGQIIGTAEVSSAHKIHDAVMDLTYEWILKKKPDSK